MDTKSKITLEDAMDSWKKKGNKSLVEACAEALEADQMKSKCNKSK